ncbi:hypothetical protein A2U01_0113235, partial [Trifolium medium]|nr:hypothetical protein [Trifolium medium]
TDRFFRTVTGSRRFMPVPSGFLPVSLTSGFGIHSGPLLFPVHGRIGRTGRSGSYNIAQIPIG